jgi:hypothetical protein
MGELGEDVRHVDQKGGESQCKAIDAKRQAGICTRERLFCGARCEKSVDLGQERLFCDSFSFRWCGGENLVKTVDVVRCQTDVFTRLL